MATTVGDWKISGAAAGFSLGFGFLTVWKAIKQTNSIKRPYHSTYVILVWAEIIANIGLGIIAWLYMEEIIPRGFELPLSYIIYFPLLLLFVTLIQITFLAGFRFPFSCLPFGSLRYNVCYRLSSIEYISWSQIRRLS